MVIESTVLMTSCLALAAAAASAETPTELPRQVRPTHYDVAIAPEPGALTFTGKATISLEVLQPIHAITLNAVDLTFADAKLQPKSDAAVLVPRVDIDAARQTATFTFERPLPSGSYDLSLSYTGRIGTQAAGLYALDYDTSGGHKRALFTQFENSDARRMVPSWDEPAYKATFDLRVDVPAGQMAVSNMPIARSEDLAGGRSRVQFARTPKMSTYLLYLAMGDFERATKMAGPTEIGVVTKRGSLDQAAFALDASVEVLAEYNDYFGVPYPLPKLDNVAAPGRSQFFGAMENWGAISSFEYYLLLDPAISTQSDRQTIFSVAAHEISHQWFGDLVTMSWWDDLWLNESFASWMAARTTAKLRPEWSTSLATVKARDKAMERDALATTHPIVQHIETVEQASQAFDTITYEKGEAVIRMLEGYVGADGWRAGVRSYMRDHAYGNTTSEDLWKAVETAAAQPVRDIAHDFTQQPGIPLIRIDDVTCVDGTSEVRLSQAEFSNDRPGKTPLRWRVPVIASTLGGSPVRTVVTDGKASVKVPGCGPVILNVGQSGYYRTLYEPAQFRQLVTKFPSVPPIDQLGLLSDARALGRAGLQPASDVLELTKAAPVEADPQVWGSIADIYREIDDDAHDDPARRATFRAFASKELTPVFARVGWSPRAGERDAVSILRNVLIRTLGELADPAVVAEARRRYEAQATDPSAVPGALRKSILAVVARNADVATWENLHAAALREKTPLVKDQLYFMLASSVEPSLAQRALDLALTDEPGATTSAEMIATVALEHPDLAFDFAIKHRELVDTKVDPISSSRYYARLAFHSANRSMVAKLKSYADAHRAETSRGDTELAAAAVDDRIRVRSRVLPDVSRWLANEGFIYSGY